MEEIKTSFEEQIIFNQVKIDQYLEEKLKSKPDNNSVFVCGKLFSHVINAKYSFKACDFLIYLPHYNKLYYSVMNSDDCFTSTLKWNQNFFKKIRLCLESDMTKNTYFIIDYENREKSKNVKNIIIEIDEKDSNEELEFSDKPIYFELHFLVDTQDIVAFRMLLNSLIDDKPQYTLMNKLLEYDKQESEKLLVKQKKFHSKEKEIERMEKEIKKAEEESLKFKKESIYKLYFLNKEKNRKIVELKHDLEKEKRLSSKFK
jgi:hypothetical protein